MWIYKWTRWTTHWEPAQFRQHVDYLNLQSWSIDDTDIQFGYGSVPIKTRTANCGQQPLATQYRLCTIFLPEDCYPTQNPYQASIFRIEVVLLEATPELSWILYLEVTVWINRIPKHGRGSKSGSGQLMRIRTSCRSQGWHAWGRLHCRFSNWWRFIHRIVHYQPGGNAADRQSLDNDSILSQPDSKYESWLKRMICLSLFIIHN